jgi:hypothetical protein
MAHYLTTIASRGNETKLTDLGQYLLHNMKKVQKRILDIVDFVQFDGGGHSMKTLQKILGIQCHDFDTFCAYSKQNMFSFKPFWLTCVLNLMDGRVGLVSNFVCREDFCLDLGQILTGNNGRYEYSKKRQYYFLK